MQVLPIVLAVNAATLIGIVMAGILANIRYFY
ncbi:hypothetical protein JOC25_000012 [Solibacillus kalamii]|nr:hypothetical protein [Solibacillus kalamii]